MKTLFTLKTLKACLHNIPIDMDIIFHQFLLEAILLQFKMCTHTYGFILPANTCNGNICFVECDYCSIIRMHMCNHICQN